MDALARSAAGWGRLELVRAQLRVAWADETSIKISQPRPPVVTEWSRGIPTPHEEDPSKLGYTLTAQMLNLLGHPSKYFPEFAVRRVLEDDVPAWCRGHERQPHHRYPDGSMRLAHYQVGRLLIYSDLPLERIAQRTELRVGAVRIIGWATLRFAKDLLAHRAMQPTRHGVYSRPVGEGR